MHMAASRGVKGLPGLPEKSIRVDGTIHRLFIPILAAAITTAPNALAADRDPFAGCSVNFTLSGARLGMR